MFAGVAQPGQRRKVQILISKEFVGSNPTSRIFHYQVFLVILGIIMSDTSNLRLSISKYLSILKTPHLQFNQFG